MDEQQRRAWLEETITRRQAVRGALAGGFALSASGLLAACGGSDEGGGSTPAAEEATASLRRGGTMRVGAPGGGAEDTIDAHRPTSTPDIARVHALYDPLAIRRPDFSELEMVLAESIEPDGDRADRWVVRLKPGLEFHNGKPVTAEDVVFSLRRITDPKDPLVGNAALGYIDRNGLRAIDERTVRIPLEFANSTFPDDLGQYFNGIVPTDYDPERPVGTGAFKFQSFQPGERSVFVRHENFWGEDEPYLDQLEIVNLSDPTARVNALLSGQVQAITDVPPGQFAAIQGNRQLKTLVADTGVWTPFTMRVDVAPFDDVRVRQAFRLMVDREQMVQQVLSGQGRVANDLYAPFDPCYAKDLPQRQQDLEQARSLLQQAGQSDLRVELNTGEIYQGVPEAAQVFAEQAKAAGVTVQVRKRSEFYGDQYLSYPFAQDFWATRTYLAQVAQGSLPDSPFNETHWEDETFQGLIRDARGELDEARRCEILAEAQRIEYEQGGHIIPYFLKTIDAHSATVGGFQPARSGFRLGNFRFRSAGFLA